MRKARIRSLAERHSPPSRKRILNKTYTPPEKVVPVQVIRIDKGR